MLHDHAAKLPGLSVDVVGAVEAFPECDDVHAGFARFRCPDGADELRRVAWSQSPEQSEPIPAGAVRQGTEKSHEEKSRWAAVFARGGRARKATGPNEQLILVRAGIAMGCNVVPGQALEG
jgi:hypothetical protein